MTTISKDINIELYPLNSVYDRVSLPADRAWEDIEYFVVSKLEDIYPGKYQHYTYFKQDHALACYKYRITEREIIPSI